MPFYKNLNEQTQTLTTLHHLTHTMEAKKQVWFSVVMLFKQQMKTQFIKQVKKKMYHVLDGMGFVLVKYKVVR